MTAMILTRQDRPQLRRGARRSVDPLTGDPILLVPEGVLVLNDVADHIIRCCDGRRTITEIVTVLTGEYHGVNSGDVFQLLSDLIAQHVMVRNA